MTICETTDFIYPTLADVYHPIVSQGAYGDIKRSWVLDKTIACAFNPAGVAYGEDIKPNVNITQKNHLFGRAKTDLRFGDDNNKYSILNVIITNIRTSSGTSIYNETAGARSGKPTIFEITTQDPILGAFGEVEYYKLVICRSENQRLIYDQNVY